ncbi:MFS transporter [Adlercreutzia sp. ZJ154]|uniref:MFS transporter n=1 Tax=Adlercreutzia sp. ZJ154 TaxID=2709790 RepID=UPI0013EAA3F7|nr:MFS transporter [Adlercreutzia sp. ZJ154]
MRDIGKMKAETAPGFKLTGPLVALLTIASGLAIGNLYWAQPLLVQIAGELDIAVADSGLLITSTQVGYALGILLIVPLGDICPRRKLIAIVMLLAALSLVACAIAPSFLLLAFALSALGITTVSGQIIVPMTRDLADPSQQGKAVGTVAAGITIGILAARTVSGLVADLLGWRAIYALAAGLNLALMAVIWRCLPRLAPKEHVPYGRLIGDVFASISRYRALKWILLTNGLVFGVVFNLFWNAVTFRLGGAPFDFTTFQIGLVSLAGVTGAAGSVGVGKLQDKGLGIPAVGAFIALSLASMLLALFAGSSVAIVVVAAALYSLGVQGVGTLNQLRVMALDPAKSSRLNTVFVFNNFVFSALGSAASGLIWAQAGWSGICMAALAALSVSFAGWLTSRKMS